MNKQQLFRVWRESNQVKRQQMIGIWWDETPTRERLKWFEKFDVREPASAGDLVAWRCLTGVERDYVELSVMEIAEMELGWEDGNEPDILEMAKGQMEG